jgi:hypothetical protein
LVTVVPARHVPKKECRRRIAAIASSTGRARETSTTTRTTRTRATTRSMCCVLILRIILLLLAAMCCVLILRIILLLLAATTRAGLHRRRIHSWKMWYQPQSKSQPKNGRGLARRFLGVMATEAVAVAVVAVAVEPAVSDSRRQR